VTSVRVLLALLVSALVTACSAAPAPAPGRDRDLDPGSRATPSAGEAMRIRYVVVPHPDDEFSAWSLLARDTSHYLVFLLLTQGEAGGSCTGQGLQAELGERRPVPTSFAGPGSAACRAQRLDSFWAFLAGMARTDGHLDVPREVPTEHDHRLFVGERTAALVFDLGDGQVTPDGVVAAVAAARAERPAFPVTEEDDVVGAAYDNESDPDWYRYDHDDQGAVQEALWSTDLGTPGPQIVRTWPDDPRRSLTRRVPDDVYDAAMGVAPGPADPVANPGARRTGVLQQAYGWLAFPGAYWAESEGPTAFFFSRTQHFWSRW
jgi:hypothetical protein